MGRDEVHYTLITGACGGLGRAYCYLLAKRGEALFLTGQSERRLADLSERLHAEYGIPVRYHVCDLRSEEDRRRLYAAFAGLCFSRLIYAAGVDTQMPFEEMEESSIVTLLRTDLEGAASCMREVFRHALSDGSTEFLMVGSMVGLSPVPYFALYSAGKSALASLCKGVRWEWKGRAKVTCVLPGAMPTREDVKENILKHGFFSRISAKEPSEVARISLKAAAKNRRTVIVGGWNKLFAFLSACAPLSLRMRILARTYRGTRKDHYA